MGSVKKVVYCPSDWGTGKTDLLASVVLKGIDQTGKREIDDDLAAQKSLRDGLSKVGFTVVDVDSSDNIPPLDENKFVVVGRTISQEEELKIVKQRIPGVSIPKTVSSDEFQKNPFYPVMVKEEDDSGNLKFLIENKEQFEKFKEFCKGELPGGYHHQHRLDKFVYQEVINTPSNHFTSIRILASATGEIFASSLIYSDRIKGETGTDKGKDDFEPTRVSDFLLSSRSPFYLGSNDITSNVGTGGGVIILNLEEGSKKPDEKEKEILRAHGMDEENPKLPESLLSQASQIAQIIGKQKGLYVGIDFIPSIDGTYKYLETNNGPRLTTLSLSRTGTIMTSGKSLEMLQPDLIQSLLK